MTPLDAGDYIGIMFCYLILAWPPHLAIAVLGSVAALMLRVVYRQWSLPVLKTSWLFAISLFLCGFAFNIIWNIVVFDRLYWSYDYAGYECSPFGLFIPDGIEAPAQYYHGMTERAIQCLWFIYAVTAWGSALLLTRFAMKRKPQFVEHVPPGGRGEAPPP